MADPRNLSFCGNDVPFSLDRQIGGDVADCIDVGDNSISVTHLQLGRLPFILDASRKREKDMGTTSLPMQHRCS